jgi:hypothetical protein
VSEKLVTVHEDELWTTPLPNGWVDLHIQMGNGGPGFLVDLNPEERKKLAEMLLKHPNDEGKLVCYECGGVNGVKTVMRVYSETISAEADICEECDDT